MNIQPTLKYIEKKYNVKVVYANYDGSLLYGTNNENSDIDIKFLFVPTKEDVLLKRDIDNINADIKDKNSDGKNTKNAVDFSGQSIYMFFNLLEKMETNAVNILFSMFSKDSILYEDLEFTNEIRSNYNKLINRNMKSFIGYSLGQVKKFGVKGQRYNELDSFIKKFYVWSDKREKQTLMANNKYFKAWVEKENYKYIKFIMAPGPNKVEDIEYIEVLGKKFLLNITNEYFYDKISSLYNQFGNRAKTVAETKSKVDLKALSHSFRVAKQTEELLSTGKIIFPLTYANEIKEIKETDNPSIEYVEEVINKIETILTNIDELLETTSLNEESDRKLMDYTIIYYIKIKEI